MSRDLLCISGMLNGQRRTINDDAIGYVSTIFDPAKSQVTEREWYAAEKDELVFKGPYTGQDLRKAPTPDPPGMGRCKLCDAPILWSRVRPSGKTMPLDFAPSDRGNVYLDGHGTAHVLNDERRRAAQVKGYTLYLSHFVTCPKSKEARKK
jgi:hypothetical protein